MLTRLTISSIRLSCTVSYTPLSFIAATQRQGTLQRLSNSTGTSFTTPPQLWFNRLNISSKQFTSSVKMSDAPYKIITTQDAPSAIGPYSQAVVHNGLVFASGCIPFVPSTMTLIEGDIQAQARQALANMLAVIGAAGSDKSHILKTTVFLKDMNDFAKINEVYEQALAPYKPARSAVEVARLPRDVGVEIECIAALKQ